jgi:beta-lactamase class D
MRVFLLMLTFQLNSLFAQEFTAATNSKIFWKEIFKQMKEFKKIFKKQDTYQLEIIYTQINRNTDNTPTFTIYKYGNSENYFYPASLVKLPVAIFALEKLRSNYADAGLDYYIKFDTNTFCNNHRYQNYSYKYVRANGKQTFQDICKRYRIEKEQLALLNPELANSEQPIKKSTAVKISLKPSLYTLKDLITAMIVYSDNESYNKILDFVGQDYITMRCKDLRLNDIAVTRKFLVCDEYEQNISRPFILYNHDTIFIAREEMKISTERPVAKYNRATIGKAHLLNGQIINKPRNFTGHNRISLYDINKLLIKLVMNEHLEGKEKLNLSRFEQRVLLKLLGLYPQEDLYIRNKTYEFAEDGYTLFLMNGNDTSDITTPVRAINICGQAYGYTNDCAYFFDTKNNVEFFLAARIYTNKNNVLGDDLYEYNELAFPFMKKLGEVIYQYELKREKSVLPQLNYYGSLFK